MRQSIEKASLPLLSRLNAVPRVVPFLSMLVVLVGGAVIGGAAGFVLIGMATGFVAWLLYLSWPHLSTPERLMRCAVVLLALAMAVTQIFPR